MKSILDYMNQVGKLIKSKRGSVKGPVQVFFLDGKFRIGKVDLTAWQDCVLIPLTKSDIENGLQNWQWLMIQRKILDLVKEGKLK